MIDVLLSPLRTQILSLVLCLAALGCSKGSSTPTPPPSKPKPALGIPTLIKDINPGPGVGVDGELVAFREELYFPGADGEHGTQLWKTDGTSSGTVLVKDIRPKTKQNVGRPMVATSRHLYVITSPSAGCDLWSSDGSTTGTVKIKSGPDIGFLSPVGGEMTFFVLDSTTGCEIWKTSGTRAGTKLIKVIGPVATSGSRPSALLVHEGQVLFVANDSNAKSTLFAISSSMHDVRVLAEVRAPGAPASFQGAVYFGDEVKLSTYFNIWELSLWRTDATRAGTQKLAVIHTWSKGPFAQGRASLHNLTVVGDKLYFISWVDTSSARNYHKEFDLWSSDGTTQGTRRIKNLGDGKLVRTAVLRDEFYFGATSGGEGLWKIDRTTGDPVLLGSFASAWVPTIGLRHGMSGLAALEQQGVLLFAATKVSTSGMQPWVSGGTPESTSLLKEIRPGEKSPLRSRYLVPGGGRYAWFMAEDDARGEQLWWTNGTPDGTRRLSNIRIQSFYHLHPTHVATLRGRIVFTVSDVEHGVELWSFYPGALATEFGPSCSREGPAPALRAQDPVVGKSFAITGRGPNTHTAFILFDWVDEKSTRVPPKCDAILDSFIFHDAVPLSSQGTWSQSYAIPGDPALVGLEMVTQAWLLPNAGSAFHVDYSNAARLTFGY